MSVHSHRADAPQVVRVALVTLSDTRTEATDGAGRAGKALVQRFGHVLADYRILPDEPAQVVDHVRGLVARDTADVVVTAGGTGISARDRTFEAMHGVIERPLPGFGELFRQLSYAQIGAASMLSRALGGTLGRALVFCCPGSEAALTLALEQLILPEAGHLVREVRR